MRWKDRFRFVRQNMKKNKVRVFMTVLATAIGCAFLIVLASVGFGLHQSIVKDTMEQNIVTKIDVYGKETEDGNYQSITDSDIKEMEKVDGVQAVTRRKMLIQHPTFTLENYQINTRTVVANFPSETKAGFELSKGSLPKAENEIVIGYNVVDQLVPTNVEKEDIYNEQGLVKDEYRYDGDLIGRTIQMEVVHSEDSEKTKTFSLKIVGIGEKPTREWAQDQDIFISDAVLSQIEAFTGTPKGVSVTEGEDLASMDVSSESYDEVAVYAETLAQVQAITDTLSDKNYATYSVVDELKQVNMMFTIAKAGLILIGTIALLIASIGIYNTMTMAVTERAPDIGIMKAIGANPKVIKQIFLLESSYIGLIGAIIGTIAAYIVSFAVNLGLPWIIELAFDEELPETLQFSAIPWTLVVISVVICLLVTILSGLRPAKRATKIDVLQAMRREV
ncbi:ABC transporter permease [Radiobacillus kanasensis]|uniref:ABC transporter permease n=1 Tax=Radiobacillus kanasensis TaxID=2844358 RepID=UPI001E2B715F|nr:ABC transporter permease [Radiobacillus kanasensis]UFT97759.1 ABC transporter permease [Radiobacillus kanasensis]